MVKLHWLNFSLFYLIQQNNNIWECYQWKINELVYINFYTDFEIWFVFYTYRTNEFKLEYVNTVIIFEVVNSHLWLVGTVLDNAVLETKRRSQSPEGI